MSLVDGPAHLNPWKKMMETLNFCIVVLLRVFVQGKEQHWQLSDLLWRNCSTKMLYHINALSCLMHLWWVKLEATPIQLNLKVLIINSNNHWPHFFMNFIILFPHHMGFKGRPSNHKISWGGISIFLILTSQVTNPLHPNIIMHTLHTVLYIFSRF